MRIISIKFLYIVFIFCICSELKAQISVTALQPPVWKERNGIKTALFPGEVISTDDVIYSGKNGRVLLDFNEGSVVELGEETTTLVKAQPHTKDTITSAAINILQGAFRYTAGILGSNKKRDIKINLTTATIGIRGTDLWGRSNKNEDFVVLIEGDIVIDHESKQQIRMRDGQSVYRALAGKKPEPLSRIEVPELLALAKETALIPSKASIYTDGTYSVVLASSLDIKIAKNKQDKYLQQGYPIKNSTATISDIEYTRSQINGFKTLEDARLFLQQANDELNVSDAWILKKDN